MITIIDYGMGNLGSIRNMLKKVGVSATISADKGALVEAEKLILPGVGAFDRGIERLAELDLIEALTHMVVEEKKPILGICLGAQLMTLSSEEGKHPGLGLVPIRTKRFRFAPEEGRKVPHMGWNIVYPRPDAMIFRGVPAPCRFYFVHSYYMACENSEVELATTNYGLPFTSAYRKDNILGVQFHPEKSHTYGMKLMQNFADWPEDA